MTTVSPHLLKHPPVSQLIRCGHLGVLIALSSSIPAIAQTSTLESERAEPISHSAADLRIAPRLGIGHTSSGAGFDGFTRFQGFIPLQQNPGQNLTFMSGQLLVDNGGNLGGNVLVGHRFFDPMTDRVWGAYLGYDHRDTGSSRFNQIGVGIESLGEGWDFRVNGYIPIGDTGKQVSQQTTDTGFVLSTAFFQGNDLILQGQRQRQTIRMREAAMTGFDVEAGGRLLKIGDRGDLRGYGGLYFYDAGGSPDILGWRLRLEARPIDYFNLGLSVQDDPLFGANVVFSVSANFPGSRPRGPIPSTETALARMGEDVIRTASITVDNQQESEVFSESISEPAINPDTDQAYVFRHVQLGSAGGDGAAETPLGTLNDALAIANSNDLVYLQGSGPDIPGGFTIPDGVAVLSSGPSQSINTQQLGIVELPASNSGNFPTITDTVTLSSNTTLSGFRITSPVDSGIVGTGIENVAIQDNRIEGAGLSGIFLENVAGQVVIRNNVVDSSFERGIDISLFGSTSQTLILQDNTISNNGLEGIVIEAGGNAQVSATVQSNTLTGNGEAGVAVIGDTTSSDSICVNLADNRSDTNYDLEQFSGLFQVVNLAGVNSAQQTGTVNLSGVFADVTTCP